MASKNFAANYLETWFSSERMKTYSFHPNPEALYLWNTHVTKAFLEDIQHIEVLLRNRVDVAVSAKYGERWYIHPAIPFDRQAKKSVSKAERRAGVARGQVPPPGRVIAELSLDFWAYLFTRTYASTIWPLVQKTLVATSEPNGSGIHIPSLVDFKREIDVVYKLRNRCAHHEPIIKQDQQSERAGLDHAQKAIRSLARWLDPDAAEWIVENSRVTDLRNIRP
ncbi:Abi family protein [Corynebacterium accolens]|uniref:Abi family protein n=1 Tax=Corynebacterium accolens TaxID=38284 RepID=A0ABT7FMR6_9CORY|nr:Abi family protein [Corynebacterium accolens]MDK4246625.1 Abi family protein [Corynebacterium accolens]MDK4266808.1 Abi family protein [Corynebacterium accolens]MDK4308460.1 Abi family protein [Corynebacterium accolens]MDK4312005.1 Abi family protein [Corynebacterium accolens]MDK4324103.1 Abi family protein [Corynebacterium accolens]